LFAEIDAHTKFSVNVYAATHAPRFVHMANLFHPSTIRASHAHWGQGPVPGIKNNDNEWDTAGHRDRIIEISIAELALFASLYDEEGTPAEEARLPALHARTMIPTLQRFECSTKLGQIEHFPSRHLHESGDVREGIIRRFTNFPGSADKMILSGPHFFVGAPFYKCPRRTCVTNRDYDVVDLDAIPTDYLPRSNFAVENHSAYDEKTPRVSWSTNGMRPRITDLFRVAANRGIDPRGERTLQPAIVQPGIGHIDGVYTYAFPDVRQAVLTAATWASLPIDFFVRSTGAADFRPSLGRQVPAHLGHEPQMLVRALGLNCLTIAYAPLWNGVGLDALDANDGWTREDHRLDTQWFAKLRLEWNRDSALRSAYCRRQALLELDILAALARVMALY
jgi:hypothetical protein